MSQILKALKRAQQKYTGNVKAVLMRNESAVREVPIETTESAEAGPVGRTKTIWFLWYANAVLYLILAFSITMNILMNERLSSRVNLTDDQIGVALNDLKKQEERVTQLNHSLLKVAVVANDRSDETNAKLGDLTQKVASVKEALISQGKTMDLLSSGYKESNGLLKTYRTENQELKQEVAALKEKIDATIHIPKP
jgi:hypothetical protein